METTRIKWKNEDALNNILNVLSDSKISITELGRRLSKIYNKEIQQGSFAPALNLLKEILGEDAIMYNSRTYYISSSDLNTAKELVGSYFRNSKKIPELKKDTEESIKTKRKYNKSSDSVNKKELETVKNILQVYEYVSPYKEAGLDGSTLYLKMKRFTGKKTYGSKDIENYCIYLEKKGLPSIRDKYMGRTKRYVFYDERSRKALEATKTKLECLIKGMTVEEIADSIEEKILTSPSSVLLSDESEKKNLMIAVAKIMYLNNKGVSKQDIVHQLFLREGKQIGSFLVEEIINIFKMKLNSDIFKFNIDNFRILNYSEAMSVIAPEKVWINFMIKVPNYVNFKVNISKEGVNLGLIMESDKDEKYTIYEVQAKNSSALTSSLVRLVLGVNIIMVKEDGITEEIIPNVKDKSVILTRTLRDNINEKINSLIKGINEVI